MKRIRTNHSPPITPARRARRPARLTEGRPASGVLAAAVAEAQAQQSSSEPDYSTWDQYLGGVDSSQYSALDQIDKSNVTELEVAWTYETGDNPSFNPIVVDGVMYLRGAAGALVALDGASGRVLWTNEVGPGSRGLSYWESEDRSDRRLLYLNRGMLTAVDAGTGRIIE